MRIFLPTSACWGSHPAAPAPPPRQRRLLWLGGHSSPVCIRIGRTWHPFGLDGQVGPGIGPQWLLPGGWVGWCTSRLRGTGLPCWQAVVAVAGGSNFCCSLLKSVRPFTCCMKTRTCAPSDDIHQPSLGNQVAKVRNRSYDSMQRHWYLVKFNGCCLCQHKPHELPKEPWRRPGTCLHSIV